MHTINRIQEAEKLPAQWDALAESIFQQQAFLLHVHKYNPCRQRYYVCFDENKLVAAAIVYTLQLDLLTNINIKSPIKTHIVGIPCSVSCSGIFGHSQAIAVLKNYIFNHEKGFVLVLNLNEKPQSRANASGITLPTILFNNKFSSWTDYLNSLRSTYRRRINQINRHQPELRFDILPCTEFTEEMYEQYLNVYRKSSGKLEKLNLLFFKNLPSQFLLAVCYKNEKVIGWNITISWKNSHYFFLGGIDYTKNKMHHTYLQLLASIVKVGIAQGAKFIDLGQTAETPKMRMGGTPVPRYMEAHHSNSALNFLLRLFSPILEYKTKAQTVHPMKENDL